MKNAKKVLCLTLILLFTLGTLLTGCGGQKAVDNPKTAVETEKSTSVATSTAASTNKPELKPVELTWYSYVGSKMKDEDVVFDELNKYLKEKINATVKQNLMTYEDYNTKVPVIVSSGQPFDISFTAGWVNQYLPNVSKGAFAPLNDLLDNYAKETKDFLPKPLWDAVSVGGKIFGIPTYKEIGH